MKKFLNPLVCAIFLMHATAHADDLGVGKLVRFHSAPEKFGAYFATSSGCPSSWFYVNKTDMDVDSWKNLLAVSLTAYTTGKTVAIYSDPGIGCANQKFNVLETVD